MLCHTESLFFRYELEKSETHPEYLDSAFEYIKQNYKMKNLDYFKISGAQKLLAN